MLNLSRSEKEFAAVVFSKCYNRRGCGGNKRIEDIRLTKLDALIGLIDLFYLGHSSDPGLLLCR